MANPSKCHLLLAELNSHREEVDEGDEEVSGVAVEDPTLTSREETGLVLTAHVAT